MLLAVAAFSAGSSLPAWGWSLMTALPWVVAYLWDHGRRGAIAEGEAAADTPDLHVLYERMEAIDGFTAESRASRLLHGLGFASALSEIGLPEHALVTSLLMFNVGVELGQLAFVALILLLHRSLTVLAFRWPRWAELGPAYLIGILGAYWTIQRTVMML